MAAKASLNLTAAQINLTDGVLGASLHALNLPEILGIVVALVLGGMVKGIVSIGVPLVAMPILSQFLPIQQAVLLLSMPIILGNIPQALEGGEMLPTVRRIAAPLMCAEHAQQLGGESPLSSLMVAKD